MVIWWKTVLVLDYELIFHRKYFLLQQDNLKVKFVRIPNSLQWYEEASVCDELGTKLKNLLLYKSDLQILYPPLLQIIILGCLFIFILVTYWFIIALKKHFFKKKKATYSAISVFSSFFSSQKPHSKLLLFVKIRFLHMNILAWQRQDNTFTL